MLIDRLNRCFLEFDQIVEKYHIEKIKTIGDAYMCAGGIPHENQTHPIEIILAAMEMQATMHQMGAKENHDNTWDIRIGIDTGPVVAGVIGRNKISYDIWGSTVNMASRMEALSEPGKINISGNTYTLVKDFFLCQYRGKMPVKNGGEVDMYFVEGLKPHFASDMKGFMPNESFQTHLQLLRLNDLEEKVFEKLEELPSDLFYHNLKHTVDVVTQVELIGKAEGVSAHDLLMLKTAALFHDTGHLVSYDRHEEEGVKMAREMLPRYHYTPEQIDRVERLILATRMPPAPQNLLEEIICDADLDYLGRTDFLPVAYNLYKELKTRNKVESFEDWKKIQMDFIRNHSYFTTTARNLREVNKNKQLERILEELRDKNGATRKKR
jgi:HD superfamily phosphodiesterase